MSPDERTLGLENLSKLNSYTQVGDAAAGRHRDRASDSGDGRGRWTSRPSTRAPRRRRASCGAPTARSSSLQR